MEENKKIIDLTDAWIDWKKTCAATDCSDKKNSEKIFLVMQKSFNEYITKRIFGESKKEFLEFYNSGCVIQFELEKHLYQNNKEKGRAVKNNLFAKVANKRDHDQKNPLTCYMIRIMIHHFFGLFKKFNISKNTELNTLDDENIGENTPAKENDSIELVDFLSDVCKDKIKKHFDSWHDDVKLSYVWDSIKVNYKNNKLSALSESEEARLSRMITNSYGLQKSSRYEHTKNAAIIIKSWEREYGQLVIFKYIYGLLKEWLEQHPELRELKKHMPF